VGLLSLLTGMLLGYILEWLREHRHRRRAAQKAREAAALRDEVERLRRETGRGQDDVLALLGG
jgi:FtsZ-binding cell division protein ZapB